MKNWKRKFLLAGVLAAIFAVTVISNLFLVPLAVAQEEEVQQKTAREEKASHEYELETMIVTAEKREENIQEVPVAVSALSEIQIEDAGIMSIHDMAQQIPNLHVISTGYRTGSRFVSRGIMNAEIFDSTMGFYVDDVSYSTGPAFDTELFDIERIEVLRGPQGTLYGRNTLGGVINIVTKKPDNQWEGKASAGYGNYDSQDYRLALRGPVIKDTLFFGISGVKTKRDGFSDNLYYGSEPDDRDGTSGRGRLRWTPSENLDITFSADAERNRDGSFILVPLDDLDREINWDAEGFQDIDTSGQSLRLVYDTDFFTVTSITARRDFEFDTGNDVDFSPADIMKYTFKHDDDLWSQELRLQSLADPQSFKWLIGAYYSKDDRKSDTVFYYGEDAVAMGMVPAPMKLNQKSEIDIKGHAFFGQATYTLFDKLGITAGLRYDHEEKDMILKTSTEMMGMSMPDPDKKSDLEYNEWLPKFVLDYRWTPDLMTYASAAKGYKSGGFNYFAIDPEDVSYDPEYSLNYEIGLKSSWLDNRFIANLAAFYISWDDQQVLQGTPAAPAFKNAGETTSKGFEVELLARPATGVQLTGTFGYTDAKFDDYKDPIYDPMTGLKIGENNYDGKRVTGVPRYTYSLAAQYRHPGGLFARAELVGLGDSYWDPANTAKQSSYELVNARIGYETEYFDIYLWGENLFDKKYASDAHDVGTGTVMANIGDPLTLGITLTGRF